MMMDITIHAIAIFILGVNSIILILQGPKMSATSIRLVGIRILFITRSTATASMLDKSVAYFPSQQVLGLVLIRVISHVKHL